MKNDGKWNKLLLFGVAALLFAGGGILAVLFIFAEELGWLFFPLVLLVFATLSLAYAYILRKHELAWIRGQVGDERFYKLFPKQKEKEERRRLSLKNVPKD